MFINDVLKIIELVGRCVLKVIGTEQSLRQNDGGTTKNMAKKGRAQF